ncbi:hypothetical protein OCU04_005616 [Sclerotinia nivalis]|uniref:Uncharacterized protein n=1 Tax=Sclerotinia nivalis TaxID=352851 RepID=A0A9X0AQF7_9HELO|nr:hypothetical protein OCU04_005616 [Sclerotinia nivalis]
MDYDSEDPASYQNSISSAITSEASSETQLQQTPNPNPQNNIYANSNHDLSAENIQHQKQKSSTRAKTGRSINDWKAAPA